MPRICRPLTENQTRFFDALRERVTQLGAGDLLHLPGANEPGLEFAGAVIGHPHETRSALYVDMSDDQISVCATDDMWNYKSSFLGSDHAEALSLVEQILREGVSATIARVGPLTVRADAQVPSGRRLTVEAGSFRLGRILATLLGLQERTEHVEALAPFITGGSDAA